MNWFANEYRCVFWNLAALLCHNFFVHFWMLWDCWRILKIFVNSSALFDDFGDDFKWLKVLWRIWWIFPQFFEILEDFWTLIVDFFVNLDRFWKFSWNFCRFFWILLLCSMILEILLSGWRFYEKFSEFFLHFWRFSVIYCQFCMQFGSFSYNFCGFFSIFDDLGDPISGWRFHEEFCGDSWRFLEIHGRFFRNLEHFWKILTIYEYFSLFLNDFWRFLEIYCRFFSQFWSFLDKFWRIF